MTAKRYSIVDGSDNAHIGYYHADSPEGALQAMVEELYPFEEERAPALAKFSGTVTEKIARGTRSGQTYNVVCGAVRH